MGQSPFGPLEAINPTSGHLPESLAPLSHPAAALAPATSRICPGKSTSSRMHAGS